jgi:hypothetical protein
MMIKRIGYQTMCKQSGRHVRKRKDDMPKFVASYRRRGQYYKKELKDCGFTRPFFSHYGGWVFIGMIAIIAVALINLEKPLGWTGIDVITALFALVAVILGYQQWRAARNEISLDTFYERLETTNKLLDQWPVARPLAAPWPQLTETTNLSEDDYRCAMYVYRELDSLEYAIAKYQLGYMSPENAFRSLRTFRTRCHSSTFRALALQVIDKHSGYSDLTKQVVRKVVTRISSEGSSQASFTYTSLAASTPANKDLVSWR